MCADPGRVKSSDLQPGTVDQCDGFCRLVDPESQVFFKSDCAATSGGACNDDLRGRATVLVTSIRRVRQNRQRDNNHTASGPNLYPIIFSESKFDGGRALRHPRRGGIWWGNESRALANCAAAADESTQFDGDACHNLVPIVVPALAEQARGRVPGTVVTIEEPEPIGGVWQHYPDRFAESAGEVGDRGINRTDQADLDPRIPGFLE